jgi:hypothetical protein
LLIERDHIDLEYIKLSLSLYISSLSSQQQCAISVHPGLSILLLNLMMKTGSYIDMANSLQLQFFQDSTDVAMAALSLSDIIQAHQHKLMGEDDPPFIRDSSKETIASVRKPTQLNGETIRMKAAIGILQQAALDMLWRVGDRAGAIRWLLGRGQVSCGIDSSRL